MVFDFPSVKIPAGISQWDWLNWKWQIRNTLKTVEDFDQYFNLTQKQKDGFSQLQFSVQTTPYYAGKLSQSLDGEVLKKVIIPDVKEGQVGWQAMKDPLGEENNSPVQHIVHRYPDRVLFLVTDLCPIYCRYCTRKRFTATQKKIISTAEYQKALDYINKNLGIREVILSGGDPLILSDSILEKILKDVRSIRHVEIIRIGSRMPAVCPMRFSESFVQIIRKYQPVFIMSHFNHPAELSAEVSETLNLLADGGVSVFNQMVLINGVNNHPAIVQALCRRLLFLRVKPYYMFQCDPSLGTDHLRTSVGNSRWIQSELWGVLSGLATPRLAMDIPGGGGKVEFTPGCCVKIDRKKIDRKCTNNKDNKKQPANHFQSSVWKAQGWDGVAGVYVDPGENFIHNPAHLDHYLEEWNTLRQQSYGGVD